MRCAWMLPALLCGCSLITDFDRSYVPRDASPSLDATVTPIRLPGIIPEPTGVRDNGLKAQSCRRACQVAQACLYEDEEVECPHNPDNELIQFHGCVGYCVGRLEAASILALQIGNCGDLSRSPAAESLLRDQYCGPDASLDLCDSICTEQRGTRALEFCIDQRIAGDCAASCRALPADFWRCAIQGTYYRVGLWADMNPDASPEEAGVAGLFLCEELAQCAGAEPPVADMP